MSFRLSRPSLVAASLTGALALAACGDSVTAPGGESELISRVTLTLTPQGGGTPITAFIDDPDGAGPLAPGAQSAAIGLTAGTTYTGTVLFENRLESPPENITEEVAAEDDEHRVFYLVNGSGINVAVTDTDGSNRPLGLQYTVNATSPGGGVLRVVLCHYDASPKNASDTSCTGETDIDLSFTFSVGN